MPSLAEFTYRTVVGPASERPDPDSLIARECPDHGEFEATEDAPNCPRCGKQGARL